jgi:hypothetical protein
VDNVRLIIDISGIAARHGLVASGITTSADTPSGVPAAAAPVTSGVNGLSKVKVSFSVTTSYAGFISFLEDLERSLRILDVTNIILAPTANSGVYTYSVALNTYWLPQ